LYNFCGNAPIASTDGDGRLYYKAPSNEQNMPSHCGAYDFFFPLYLSNFTPKQGVVVQYVHIMQDYESCGVIGRLFLHRHKEWTFWEFMGGVMQGTQANTRLRNGDESAEGPEWSTDGYSVVDTIAKFYFISTTEKEPYTWLRPDFTIAPDSTDSKPSFWEI
jgi:hypothetical protein